MKDDIIKAIKAIAGKMAQNTEVCTVMSVQSNKTCTVKTLSTDVEYDCVRLNAHPQGDGGAWLTPVVGSFVLISAIDDANRFVSLFSEIENVNMELKTKAEIKCDNIEMNGGTLGGLAKVKELQAQLAKTTARIDGIINALQNGETGTQDGGALYKTNIIKMLSLLNDKENFNDIEDKKITH